MLARRLGAIFAGAAAKTGDSVTKVSGLKLSSPIKLGFLWEIQGESQIATSQYQQGATLAVKEGLDPVTALRAVTIHPARIIGCADRIGSLTAGKDADVVIWSGDPLDVMSRAERAFIDGREIYRFDYDRGEGTVLDPYSA